MTAARTKARSFGAVKTVVFSTILILLFFGSAEIAVRAWVYLFRAPAERFDMTTGTFVLVPGEYPRVGAPPIQVNSRGFVGPEFEEPRAPGVVRIVALGDSCTFGQGSGVETYPAQLAIRLNNGSDTRRYQVINGGIEGLNSELAFRRLVTKIIPLKPDIVTVYLGWNDLMKFDPAGQVERPGLAIVTRVLDRLWLIKGMRKLVFFYIRPRLSAPATGPASRTGAFSSYRPSVFENNLRSIVRTARKAGGTVLLVTLPSVVSDDMTLDDIRRSNVIFPYYPSAYAVRDYVDLIAAYNRSIREIAEVEKVRLVDLARAIDGRPDRRQLFFDTMHPNQRGRELVADILARYLRESGLLTP
jgi:lysophospholipase L1-like esterase